MTNEQLRERTASFAVQVIKFCRQVSLNEESRVICRQLIRSATSVAANYRAACLARSKAEFIAKLCIVVEEADESAFWLELVNRLELAPAEQTGRVNTEAQELVRIFSSARKTAVENRRLQIEAQARNKAANSQVTK